MLKFNSQKFHHENWPAPLFYFPIFVYYIYNSLKIRRFNYFSAVNPALKSGGMCGFSKVESYELLDPSFVPETIMVSKEDRLTANYLKEKLREKSLTFPLIFKPDRGERGFLVYKVNDLAECMELVERFQGSMDFLLQEYIDADLELGVFIIRTHQEWKISSLVSKRFLSIEGDGQSTVLDLCKSLPRAEKFYLNSLTKESLKKNSLNEAQVLPAGEKRILEHIGNHCRGTEFVNEMNHNNQEIKEAFTPVVDNINGLNYFRIDLRTKSWEALKEGDFKILEINGVSAEPGHIYDPSVNLKQAYKDLFYHWSKMAEIATEQLSLGAKIEPFSETLHNVFGHLKNKHNVKNQKNMELESFKLNNINTIILMPGEDVLNKVLEQLPEDIEPLFDQAEKQNGYDRLSMYKDDDCEVVLCRWHEKANSGYHDHDGQNCWFRCLDGAILEKRKESKKELLMKCEEKGFINDDIDEHAMINPSLKDKAYTLHFYRKSH